MLRFKPNILIFLSGLPLFTGGFLLIRKGLTFISGAAKIAPHVSSPFLPIARPLSFIWSDEGGIALMIVFLALCLGLLKARKVIVPSVQRNLIRLQSLSESAPLTALYDRKGWIILGAMMFLGMSLNFFSLPNDIRGFIDLAIGIALIQGGVTVLRTFRSLKTA